MKKLSILFILFLFIALSGCNNTAKISYPETKKCDTVDVYFGHEVADPYRWLEDDNSEETALWVEAENKITFDYLSKIPFREKIKERLTEIWNYPKYRVPFKEGDNYFFFKNDGLQNQSVLYIQDDLDSEAKVLLDPNTFSEDGTIALSNLSISKDGKLLAYSTSEGGSDWAEIFMMDIETGKKFKDNLKWIKFSGISWYKNGFFYSRYNKPNESDKLKDKNEFHKVFYHKIGDPQAKDKLIYSNKDFPLRNYYAGVTEDEKFLIVFESEATSGNTVYVKELSKKGNTYYKIGDGFDYQYSIIENIGNKLLVMTNFNATKKQLVLIDPKNPAPEKWKIIIPEKEEVLKSVVLLGGKIIASYMKDATSKAYIHNMKGELIEEMSIPGIGTLYGLNGKKDENTAFFGFTSFTFPSTIFKYDIDGNNFEIYKKPDIDFDAKQYSTNQIFYKSKDSTEIPMFIIHKKDIKLDGSNPTILYGYGGFNISLTPSFSVSRLIFLEKGGIYVTTNLRGGGEYGKEWHDAGTKLNKQNVFDDFIAAAEYLIDNKYTSSEKLAIMGGSNGGLLVGACMIQRPELFQVALPFVGVMDMLRYHKFTIGWAWAGDYGTSEESEEMFEYLYGYSPVHTIKKGVDYPATLAITADHDDRVVPLHSFKFMATLQEKTLGINPTLIRIETRAGHGAGKPTSKRIEETADVYSFTMYNLGMEY
ncbi:MAG: prolyl oligopeptidase family serine peptidase [Bacteroidales bacterium]|nr:prolyl oligopeptidase family serine peptidase [Bacteroidales bacterium]